VFVRHSEGCKHSADQYSRKCDCRKSLYIYENGKKFTMSAKTRSWTAAEELRQKELDKRDPVKIRLREIEDEEAAKAARRVIKQITLEAALTQWLAGMKDLAPTSRESYTSMKNTMLRWAARQKITYVSDVTPFLLDQWRSSWSPDAVEPYNRKSRNTQNQLQGRVQSFFFWATASEIIDRNPSLLLASIGKDESHTLPLTPEQFKELLAAAAWYDSTSRCGRARVGKHLRALFLLQRWTGLRIGDAVILPKSALVGNRVVLNMQKTGKEISVVVPDQVVEALTSLPAYPRIHPDYFFWSKKGKARVNTHLWMKKIDRLSKYKMVNFVDEQGKPLEFRSHMLRDTFAVEMLLAGMPIEKVSKLLGHSSVAVTEKYYAKWVKARLRQLEDETVIALRKQGAKVSML
jgi:integrase